MRGKINFRRRARQMNFLVSERQLYVSILPSQSSSSLGDFFRHRLKSDHDFWTTTTTPSCHAWTLPPNGCGCLSCATYHSSAPRYPVDRRSKSKREGMVWLVAMERFEVEGMRGKTNFRRRARQTNFHNDNLTFPFYLRSLRRRVETFSAIV